MYQIQYSVLTCDKKKDVNNPPDPESAQGQQFGNPRTGLTQAEPIQACSNKY